MHINVNPSSLKGGLQQPQTVFALVLKNMQPRGKIAPGTFSLILAKKNSNLPPPPG